MRARRNLAWLSVSLTATVLSVARAEPPDPAPGARALMREEKYVDAATALREYLKSNQYDGRAWGDLGYSLHAAKKWDEALPAYQKSIELGYSPPTQTYNMACAYALMGKTDEAISTLRLALERRFAEQRTLETDTDLDSLRSDPRFVELTGLNPPADLSREQQWAWDLSFMVRRMEQMHWDLYGQVSKEKFAAEVERLKKDAPGLSDSQVRARLMRIVALVGDGHTGLAGVAVGQSTLSRYPLHLFAFEDGLYIMGAAESLRELVGSKVLKIGRYDAAAAIEAVKPYCSVDNPMGYIAVAPSRLVNPSVLMAAGAAEDEKGCEFKVAPAGGGERTVKLTPVDLPSDRSSGMFIPGFVYVHEGLTGEPPLFMRHPDKRLWMEYLPEQKLVYFSFGAVQNDRDQTLADACKNLFAMVEEKGAERLVIDMRFNGGGNTGLLRPLINGLVKCDAVNKPGRLYVIIGRHTFSAAQNCVNMIEQMTSATFVGEPTGSRPAFIGESTFLVLPYSKIRVHCSSRYWQFGDSTDERVWVQPQIAAPMTFAAYAANIDPVMEAVLRAIAAKK